MIGKKITDLLLGSIRVAEHDFTCGTRRNCQQDNAALQDWIEKHESGYGQSHDKSGGTAAAMSWSRSLNIGHHFLVRAPASANFAAGTAVAAWDDFLGGCCNDKILFYKKM